MQITIYDIQVIIMHGCIHSLNWIGFCTYFTDSYWLRALKEPAIHQIIDQ